MKFTNITPNSTIFNIFDVLSDSFFSVTIFFFIPQTVFFLSFNTIASLLEKIIEFFNSDIRKENSA